MQTKYLSKLLGISAQQTESLRGRNVATAYQISLFNRQDFVQEFVDVFGTTEGAGLVYERSVSIAKRANHELMNLKGLTPHYRGSRINNCSGFFDEQFEGQPSYAEIFGVEDYCEVDPSRSTLSPGAYLMDMIRFLRRHVKSLNKKYDFWYRRPDIELIEMNYDSTFDTIPKLEIINAALQYQLANYFTNPYTDLRQKPLYVDDDTLSFSTNTTTVNLPTNLGFHQADLGLQQFNSSLAQAYISTFGPVISKNDKVRNAIGRSSLRLSASQQRMLGVPYVTDDQIDKLYGIAPAEEWMLATDSETLTQPPTAFSEDEKHFAIINGRQQVELYYSKKGLSGQFVGAAVSLYGSFASASQLVAIRASVKNSAAPLAVVCASPTSGASIRTYRFDCDKHVWRVAETMVLGGIVTAIAMNDQFLFVSDGQHIDCYTWTNKSWKLASTIDDLVDGTTVASLGVSSLAKDLNLAVYYKLDSDHYYNTYSWSSSEYSQVKKQQVEFDFNVSGSMHVSSTIVADKLVISGMPEIQAPNHQNTGGCAIAYFEPSDETHALIFPAPGAANNQYLGSFCMGGRHEVRNYLFDASGLYYAYDPSDLMDKSSLHGVVQPAAQSITYIPFQPQPPERWAWQVDTFLQQTGCTYDQLLTLLYGDLSPEEIKKQVALKFYVNKQDTAKELAMTISTQVNEDTGDTEKVIAHTANIRLSRLNRLVRLCNWSGLAAIDADWVLAVSEKHWHKDTNDSQIMSVTIPVLGVLNGWGKVFGIDMNEAVALVGPMRDYGQANGADFYQSVYGNLDHRANEKWYYEDQDSATWAVIKQGLGLTDEDLTTLARAMAQVQGGLISGHKQYVRLDMHSLAGMYRAAKLAELLNLSIATELLLLDTAQARGNAVSNFLLPEFDHEFTVTYLIDLINSTIIANAAWIEKFRLSYSDVRFLILGSQVANSDGIRQVPSSVLRQAATVEDGKDFQSNLTSSLNGVLVSDQTFTGMRSYKSLSRKINYNIPKHFINTANGVTYRQVNPLYDLIEPSITGSAMKSDMANVGYHKPIDTQNQDGAVLLIPDLRLSKVARYTQELLIANGDPELGRSLGDLVAELKKIIFQQALKKRFIGYMNQASMGNSSFVSSLSGLFYKNGEEKQKGMVTAIQISRDVPLEDINRAYYPTTPNGASLTPNVTPDLLHMDLVLCGNLMKSGPEFNDQINPSAVTWVDENLSSMQYYITEELGIDPDNPGQDIYAKLIAGLLESLLPDDIVGEYSRMLAYLESVAKVSESIGVLPENTETSDGQRVNSQSRKALRQWLACEIDELSEHHTSTLFYLIDLLSSGYFPRQLRDTYTFLEQEQQGAFNSTMAGFLQTTAADIENGLYGWCDVIGRAEGCLTDKHATNPLIYFYTTSYAAPGYSEYLTYMNRLAAAVNDFDLNGNTVSYSLRNRKTTNEFFNVKGLAAASSLQYLTNKFSDANGLLTQALSKNSLHVLEQITGWSAADMESMKQFWEEYDDIAYDTLSTQSLIEYDAVFSYTGYTGLSTKTLQSIAATFDSLESSGFNRVNAVLEAALNAQLGGGDATESTSSSSSSSNSASDQMTQTPIQTVQGQLATIRRDCYVASYLFGCSQDPDLASINTVQGVSDYLCLDVGATAALTDSWVEAAMESVQRYLSRVVQNFEEDVVSSPEISDRWGYIDSYSNWQQGRLVFQYPENFLDPANLSNPSVAYTDFQNDLISNNTDSTTVEKAFRDYLTDFETVADLEVCNGYKGMVRLINGKPVVPILLVGKTSASPTQFYYRLANFIVTPQVQQVDEDRLLSEIERFEISGGTVTPNWQTPWCQINVQINAASVGIIDFNGRIFIFWTEYVADSQLNSEYQEGDSYYGQSLNSSVDSIYIKGTVKYSYFQPDQQTWSQPEPLGSAVSFVNPEGSLADAQNSNELARVTLQSNREHIFWTTPVGSGVLGKDLTVYPTLVDFQGPEFCQATVVSSNGDNNTEDYQTESMGASQKGVLNGTLSYPFSNNTSANAYCIGKRYSSYTDSYCMSFHINPSTDNNSDSSYYTRCILTTQNKKVSDDSTLTSQPGSSSGYVGPALTLTADSSGQFKFGFCALQKSGTQDSPTIAISNSLKLGNWYSVTIRVNTKGTLPLVICEVRDASVATRSDKVPDVLSVMEVAMDFDYCGLFSASNANANGPILAIGSTMPGSWVPDDSEVANGQAFETADDDSSHGRIGSSAANLRAFAGNIQGLNVFRGHIPIAHLRNLKPSLYLGEQAIGNPALFLSGWNQASVIANQHSSDNKASLLRDSDCVPYRNFNLESVSDGGIAAPDGQRSMKGQISYQPNLYDGEFSVRGGQYSINGLFYLPSSTTYQDNALICNSITAYDSNDNPKYLIIYSLSINTNTQKKSSDADSIVNVVPTIVATVYLTNSDGTKGDAIGSICDSVDCTTLTSDVWYNISLNTYLDVDAQMSYLTLQVWQVPGSLGILHVVTKSFDEVINDTSSYPPSTFKNLDLRLGVAEGNTSDYPRYFVGGTDYANFSLYASGGSRYSYQANSSHLSPANLLGNLPDDSCYTPIAMDYESLAHGLPQWFILNGEATQYLGYPSYQTNRGTMSTDTPLFKNTDYGLSRVNSPVVSKLMANLMSEGVSALMSVRSQTQIESLFSLWCPYSVILRDIPDDRISFISGANQLYYWELWCYCPWLISNTYSDESMYEQAIEWLHYIYNPNVRIQIRSNSGSNGRWALTNPNDVFWRFLGLRAQNNPYLAAELKRTPEEEEVAELSFGRSVPNAADAQPLALGAWIYDNDPDDANAVSMTRPIAYQKSIVLALVEAYINYANSDFIDNSRESIGQAQQLYTEALELLGPQPADVGACPMSRAETVGELNSFHTAAGVQGTQPIPEFIGWIEDSLINQALENTIGVLPNAPDNYVIGSYFQVDENPRLINDYDTINQSLGYINAMLTYDGQPDYLPLYSPNPLVATAYSAIQSDTSSNMASLSGIGVPYFNFPQMAQYARQTVNFASNLADRLQGALTANDQQYLSNLITDQQAAVYQMMIDSLEFQIEAINNDIAALEDSLQLAQDTNDHYTSLIEQQYLGAEIASFTLNGLSQVLFTAATAGFYSAAAIATFPTIFGTSNGGGQPWQTLAKFASANNSLAFQASMASSISGFESSYERMKQGWQLEQKVSQDQINATNNQLAAAYSRLSDCENQKATVELQYQQQQAIAEYKKNMFTSQSFYQWQITQCSALYRRAYQLAYNMCLFAERAYQFQRAYSDSYIRQSTWDPSKLGLMAIQQLGFDLENLCNAFIQKNQLKMQIVKTISLKKLSEDPSSPNFGCLQRLIETGTCRINLYSKYFDEDYPGQYRRQISHVAISIPCVIGPYENLKVTLTQTSNYVLLSEDKEAVQTLLFLTEQSPDENPSIRTDWFPNQQVNLSTGINDDGNSVIHFNEQGELKPFQFTGCISTWQLEIPKAQNSILLKPKNGESFAVGEEVSLNECELSLTDVIFEIHYEAEPASTDFANYVSSLVQPEGYIWNGSEVLPKDSDLQGDDQQLLGRAAEL